MGEGVREATAVAREERRGRRRAQLPGRERVSTPFHTHRTGSATGVGRARAGTRSAGMIVVEKRRREKEGLAASASGE